MGNSSSPFLNNQKVQTKTTHEISKMSFWLSQEEITIVMNNILKHEKLAELNKIDNWKEYLPYFLQTKFRRELYEEFKGKEKTTEEQLQSRKLRNKKELTVADQIEIYTSATATAFSALEQDILFKPDFFNSLSRMDWIENLKEEIETLRNPKEFYSKYFNKPEVAKQYVEQEIRLKEKVSLNDTRLHDLMQQIEKQYRSAYVTFRLVICSLASRQTQKDSTQNNKLTAGDKFNVLFTGVFSNSFTYGYNHIALQVDGWLLHYTDIGFPIIQPLSSSSVCGMLYLNKKENITREMLPRLCEKVSEWSTGKYHLMNANCQLFVNEIITAVGCEKDWIKDGPIEKFIDLVKTSESRTNKIIFYDPVKKRSIQILSYADLKRYWRSEVGTQKEYSNANEKVFKELQEVVKCIERGYQLSNHNGERHDADALFPLPDGIVAITSSYLY